MDNEADRTWNKEMHSLIREMIHYQNQMCHETEPDAEKIRWYEERYRATLQKAKEEYEYVPVARIIKMAITYICGWKSICLITFCSCMITEFQPQTMNLSDCSGNTSENNSRPCHSGDSNQSSISANA